MMTRSTMHHSYARAVLWLGAIAWCCTLLLPLRAKAQFCSQNMLRIFGAQSYVATPDVQALHLTHGFTIECWARLDTTSASGAALVDKGTFGIVLQKDSTVSGYVQHSTSIQIAAPVDSVMSWHHYALVFTPGDSVRLYIDSSEAASALFSSATIDSNTDSLRIGMSISGRSWMGAIDEFRVWNVSRTLAEIKQTMFHTLAGSEAGLVLYYAFDDETDALRIHDFSGHGRDGFIRGANAAIIPSSSPILNSSRGWRLVAVESSIVIPTRRCSPSFDTVIHVRNLGTSTLLVDTASFTPGSVFSIEPNAPFRLPADSNVVDSLRLHFQPDSGGTYRDSLYISSSDTCGGAIRIGIEATYDSVGLRLSIDTVRFDSVSQCSRDTVRTIAVRNTSSTDAVTILGANVPPNSGLRILDTFPITLAKNGSASLSIALLHGGRGAMAAAIALQLDKCSRDAMVNVTAVRKVEALSLPDSLDFGSVPSTLAGITIDTVVVVTNSGDTWTSIARAQAGPPGFLQVLGKARQGVQMGPGDTVQLHIRVTASGCGLQVGKLQITSSNCLADASAFVLINLLPAAPLSGPSADLGTTCEQKDTILFVKNPNPIPIRLDSIGFAAPAAFSSGPIFHDTIPAGDSIPVEFIFDPSQSGDYRDTAYFHTTPCATGMTVLSGNWDYANVTFDSSQLLFGRGCNITPIEERATLTNHTSRSITLTNDDLAGSQRFQLDPFGFPIVLAPGASKTFTILYTPTLGHLDTARFTLYSAEGCPVTSLLLRGSREMAKATWQEAGNFDTICPGDTEVRTLHLLDKGVDSIQVVTAKVVGTGFAVLSLPPNFGGSGDVRVEFAPSAEQQYSDSLILRLDSCGTTLALALNGSGGPEPQLHLSDTSYDFAGIPVGDSAAFCFTITNPSCTPVHMQADSSSLMGTPFQIVGEEDSGMISRGDTEQLCVRFRPASYGAFADSILLRADSLPAKSLLLRGTGLAPNVQFDKTLLDFGYVLHYASKTLMIYDTNLGNEATSITASHDGSKPFTIQSPNPLGVHARDSVAVTFAPAAATGLVFDTLYLDWSGRHDSVILRGVGTEPGLQLSAVGLDFGNVHVGRDSTLPLHLFATTQFPTIDSIAVGNCIDTFFASTKPLPYAIQNDSDTLTISVTYHAHLEQADVDSLWIYSGGTIWLVPLTARGVEAHPKVNGTYFDFGPVTIGNSVTLNLVDMQDTGEYQLFVDPLKQDTVFETTPDLPLVPIAPDSLRRFWTTFKPVRARRIVDTLQFTTSSPDRVPPVILVGTGVYPAGTGPSFGFSVASDTVEPGDTAVIPVYLNGIRLDKIDADSLTLDIRFDPQMVRMLGVDKGDGITPVTRFTRLNDSTVEASIAGDQFSSGSVMFLHTEALLGPHPLSYIHVDTSDPSADQPEASTDGAFYVSDCGGAIHGVVFAGPYATSAIVPNPVSDQALLEYTLGLDGPVSVDIYNSIGALVRHIDAGAAKTGAHTLLLDVSGLPEGRYVYRLTSLEYHSEGSMVVLR